MVGTAIIRRQAPAVEWFSAVMTASSRAWTEVEPAPFLAGPPPSSADAVLFQQPSATTAGLLGKLRDAAGSRAHRHRQVGTYLRPGPRCRCHTCPQSSRRSPSKSPNAAPSSVHKAFE